jgi:DNA-binding beta-propeller fold protein YncE
VQWRKYRRAAGSRHDQRAYDSAAGKGGTLLYVSNANNGTVSVFTYPQGALVQTLTGFKEPYGLCTNKAGDVWIVDDETAEITEYAHGGTSAKATLSDSGEYPAGCSVDPTTGNLAVANYETDNKGDGSVSVYRKAKGKPALFTDQAISRAWFCSYDDKGNLFVDGYSIGTTGFQLAELPKGASDFTNISLNQTIEVPGGVQWDGKYVEVSDENGPGTGVVYQFSISGSTGTKVTTTTMTDSQNVHQFWIDAKRNRIVVPSASLSTVGYWHFPKSGSPTKTISGLNIPEAVAISPP